MASLPGLVKHGHPSPDPSRTLMRRPSGPVGAAARHPRPASATRESWPEDAPLGELLRYSSRVILFSQGQPVDCVYRIERGLVKLSRLQPDGTDLIVGFRSAG